MLPGPTERLVMRDLVAADLAELRRIEQLPEVGRYMTWSRSTVADYEALLERCRGWAAEDPRTTWDLALATREGVLVGRVGLALKDAGRQAMVWYLLDPATWGRGYATEASRALLAFAFGPLGVRRVYADVDPRNAASARVCERLGMRHEAHFVEDVEVRGEWCDTAIYALLAREWGCRSGRGRAG